MTIRSPGIAPERRRTVLAVAMLSAAVLVTGTAVTFASTREFAPAQATPTPTPTPFARVIDGKGKIGGQMIVVASADQLGETFGRPKRRSSRTTCALTFGDLAMTATLYDPAKRGCSGPTQLVYTRMTIGWSTDKGLKVGDPASRVKEVYPRSSVNAARCGTKGLLRLANLGSKSKEGPNWQSAILAEVKNDQVIALGICWPFVWSWAGP